MIKSLFRAASGMLVRQTMIDVISNNLSNINTTGFKRNDAFARLMLETNPIEGNLIGQHDPHSNSLEEYTDFSVGPIEHTGNRLDLAIKGKGFFEIQDQNGNTFLSRNGNFTVNANEELVDANGNKVMGEGGEISVPEGKVISINDRGEVLAGEEIVGRIKVVNTDETNLLEKAGNSYYLADNIVTEVIDTAEFVTESLERSNVNTTYEMVHMIEVQREYEANQKIIHMSDSTLDKVIRDVGTGIA